MYIRVLQEIVLLFVGKERGSIQYVISRIGLFYCSVMIVIITDYNFGLFFLIF